MSAPIQIPGLPGWWQELDARYDYATAKGTCPACGGLGLPWRGWFTCQACPAVALVEDGRTWIPQRVTLEDYPDMCMRQEGSP